MPNPIGSDPGRLWPVERSRPAKPLERASGDLFRRALQDAQALEEANALAERGRATAASPSGSPRQSEGPRGRSSRRLRPLPELLAELDRRGRDLERSQTLDHLLAYLESVREVLRRLAGSAGRIRRDRGPVGPGGQQKEYVTIEAIEPLLAQMTADLLAHEAGRLALVARAAEIRGLIVDLTS